MPAQPPTAVDVTVYQFKIADDEWESWKTTVPRSKALDTRLRELIKADREGRVLPPDHDGDRPSSETYDVVDEAINSDDVVSRISRSWTDPEQKLDQRREAAAAALELIRRRGQLGKRHAVETLLPEFAVDGQNDETWYRQNVRPVLREVATYSPTDGAYVIESADSG